jgi:hypothetical protein
MIKVGNRYPRKLKHGERPVDILFRGETPIWVAPAVQHQVLQMWIDANVSTVALSVDDAAGRWLEIEITLPSGWSGNANDGYSGPLISGYPSMTLGLFYSQDLTAWSSGWWVDSPVNASETLGDGRQRFYARYEAVPTWWYEVLVDLVIESRRYGKSITEMTVKHDPISLPNFPYLMPDDASVLQTDLRATGYPDATVTTETFPYSCEVFNHTDGGRFPLTATVVSGEVTAMNFRGTAITLPGFPYSLATEAGTLQADLRDEGFSGAVVNVFRDSWTVTLPDEVCTDNNRIAAFKIDPGDPFPFWNFLGEYQGEQSADTVVGGFTNLRALGGGPLVEAKSAFGRLGFINL